MLKLITALVALWMVAATSIYDFKVPSLDGNTIDFSKYKGKNILIVNTASQCGYTKQYADLEKLYEKYKGNLVIIGFPANNFGQQEPGTNVEIAEFCSKNYGVTFPMAEKISVKGEDIHPLFKWLTSKQDNGIMDAEIKWNFTKFLIDKNGKLVAVFPSAVTPMSEEITKYLN
jgi:glutathione peroxidase